MRLSLHRERPKYFFECANSAADKLGSTWKAPTTTGRVGRLRGCRDWVALQRARPLISRRALQKSRVQLAQRLALYCGRQVLRAAGGVDKFRTAEQPTPEGTSKMTDLQASVQCSLFSLRCIVVWSEYPFLCQGFRPSGFRSSGRSCWASSPPSRSSWSPGRSAPPRAPRAARRWSSCRRRTAPRARGRAVGLPRAPEGRREGSPEEEEYGLA